MASSFLAAVLILSVSSVCRVKDSVTRARASFGGCRFSGVMSRFTRRGGEAGRCGRPRVRPGAGPRVARAWMTCIVSVCTIVSPPPVWVIEVEAGTFGKPTRIRRDAARFLVIPLQPPPDRLSDDTNQHEQWPPVVRAGLCPVSSCELSVDSGANRSDDLIQRLPADGHAQVDQSNERELMGRQRIAYGYIAAVRVPTRQTVRRKPHASQIFNTVRDLQMCRRHLEYIGSSVSVENLIRPPEKFGKRLTVVAVTDQPIAHAARDRPGDTLQPAAGTAYLHVGFHGL